MNRLSPVIALGLFLSADPAEASRPVTALTPGQSVPEGVSAADWSRIRDAYLADRHAAYAIDGGYVARNPGQAWRTTFDGRGFETSPDAGGWSWGLELVGYGRGDAHVGVSAPYCTDAQGGRVEYEWDDRLTEWFINDPRGLEHGYTVHRRPDDQSPDRKEGVTSRSRRPAHSQDDHSLTVAALKSASLTLTLAVRGDLRPKISADGRNVTFVSATGAAVVNYNNLTVFDATGTTLPARFEIAAFNSKFSITNSEFLRLVVDDEGATYPLTIDPFAQQAYLKASNTDAGDFFGLSVAVSGDTVVVAGPGDDSNATGVNDNDADNSAPDSGAVYVFVRDGMGNWSQQAYLKASNTEAGDLFGASVSIDGDTVVVGAIGESSNATGVNGNEADNSANESGAAYVFIRDGMGNWSQQAYLKASNTEAGDDFGASVAVSGDTVVVGAYAEDSNATGVNGNQANNSANSSGAAYVFVRDGMGTWSQQAYLKASNTEFGDDFGWSVSVSGDTVVAGAVREASNATGVDGNQANNSASGSGAAYVFVRDGMGTWSQQAYLKASNTDFGDNFGMSVSVSGDTIVVGADREDSSATGVNGNQADNSLDFAGAAYVFVRDAMDNWSQQAYLKASNTGMNDSFGWSVAANGDRVLVGAYLESSDATGANGNQNNENAPGSGAAYVFVRDAMDNWSQEAYIKASNTGDFDQFGASVAASGNTLVVGAHSEDSSATGVDGNQANNSAAEAGAAYVFVSLDSDGDGVLDPLDVCPLNTPGLPVDENGRPLRDCNEDCDFDAGDIQCIADELLGI